MRVLRFGDFRAGNYADTPGDQAEELYLLRDGDEVIYIGITGRGIWQRWFDPFFGHMGRRESAVGGLVKRMLPRSDDWTIELWTLEDCRKAAGDAVKFSRRGSLIRDYEFWLIGERRPHLNSTGNRRDDDGPPRYFDAEAQAEQDEFYNSIQE
jgi:hypothetical protein